MSVKAFLKPGKEKSIFRRHPWIYSGAIEKYSTPPSPGESVRVLNQHGQFMAWATFSPSQGISLRVWSWAEDQPITPDLVAARLQSAIQYRSGLAELSQTNAMRLVHAESDQVPGLIVDRYDQVLVVQFLGWASEKWRSEILSCLLDLTSARWIYERSDVTVRELEHLPQQKGLLRGTSPAPRIIIEEYGAKFYVDVENGQKTGFYLDQRANRQAARKYAENKRVLNCFSYTGGFSVTCLIGKADQVISLDISSSALELGEENIALNDLSNTQHTSLEGDVFKELRTLRDRGEKFDMVILDPPKFAPTQAQVKAAARGYKEINLRALKLLNPGGILFTFSCSGGISPEFFQTIVAEAAADAGIHATILRKLEQDVDHPMTLNFPEGAYLKGLILQVA